MLQALARRIVQVAQPERIILFGSAACGSTGPDSDLDVLVVVPAGSDRRRTAQRIYRNLIGFSHPVALAEQACPSVLRTRRPGPYGRQCSTLPEAASGSSRR
ncbi:MAG: nucleotidyltransferase domain-containing protein [Armatimonadetes bacterium]|nr:nucleotidyltransferase domain-containing protein [Armatimonadota bacterium]